MATATAQIAGRKKNVLDLRGVRLLPTLRELGVVIGAGFRSSGSNFTRLQLETTILSCFHARKQYSSRLEIMKLVVHHYGNPDWVKEFVDVIQVFWDGSEDRLYDSGEGFESK